LKKGVSRIAYAEADSGREDRARKVEKTLIVWVPAGGDRHSGPPPDTRRWLRVDYRPSQQQRQHPPAVEPTAMNKHHFAAASTGRTIAADHKGGPSARLARMAWPPRLGER